MKKLIKRNVVKRKKGYMYYIDGKGNLWATKMRVGGKRCRGDYYYKWAKKKREKSRR